MSDDTAQKCVSRALEKMRRHLTKVGITLSTVALTAFLRAESLRAAPFEAIAKAMLAVAALPGGQIAAGLVGTKAYQISQGVLHTMRLKLIAANSAAVVLVACGIVLASHIHEGPELVLEQSRAIYANATSFSMIIDNHASSGLYPSDFTQQLEWHKGNKFTLKVISPGNKTVPNYAGDGTHVVAVLPNGQRKDSPWPNSNESAGWEVTGGFILSWLENTPGSNIVFRPPQGFKVTWSYGPRTTWRGHPVKEIIATAYNEPRVGERSGTESFFVDTSTHEFIGYEWVNNGKPGYALYKDQRLGR
ncbi:MAG TPA: hypothetical protein VFW40_04730 [Capsulimonadaceae bacterium]|nr:hypothetical protein [Capsulimonadaceae bacterium]